MTFVRNICAYNVDEIDHSTSKAMEEQPSDNADPPKNSEKKKNKKDKVAFEDEEVKEKEYNSEDETEEWDRHRSLYNDVSARYGY